MKKHILVLIVLFTSITHAHATVWRLNNIPGTSADFSTLQEAHDSHLVLDGDTLYLEASSGTYGNLVSTKKLTILGAGYFLGENTGQQANVSSSRLTDITFNNGSQGSTISGCEIRHVIINTSEITIKRNYVISNAINSHLIRIDSDNLNNIIVKNNYLANNFLTSGSARRSYAITADKEGINNVIIKNNYMYVILHNDKKALNLGNGFSGIVQNNIIHGHNSVYNATFVNNILIDGSFSGTNNNVMNNLGNGNQFGTDNGNQSNVNMDNVFIGTGSTDGQWQLQEGSPAIDAGLGGVDCGMFGGAEPYVLSGIPAIPTIYEFKIEIDNLEQTIDVEVSVKSRN